MVDASVVTVIIVKSTSTSGDIIIIMAWSLVRIFLVTIVLFVYAITCRAFVFCVCDGVESFGDIYIYILTNRNVKDN